MVIVLNIATYIGILFGFCLDKFGKNCTVPMVMALISQIIVLIFVIFIAFIMKQDTETAAIIMDFVSSPADVLEFLRNNL